MRDAIRVIARDKGALLPQIILNIIHLVLKGAPFGGLAFVVIELVKPAEQQRPAMLLMLCLVIVALLAVNLALAIKVHTRAYLTAYDLTAKARLHLADHLRKLSLGFFKQRNFGDISALLLQDMARLESIFSNFFMDAVACVVLPCLMALFFLGLSRQLTLLMLGVTLLAIPALVLGQKAIQHFGTRLTRTRNQAAAALLEYLLGIRVLKAFNLTGTGFERLDRVMKQLKSDSMRLEVMAAAPLFLYMAILEVGFTLVPIYGIRLLGDGQIPLETLLVFLVVGYKFFEPLVSFGAFISEIRFMNIAAGRIAKVLETPPLPEPVTPVPPQKPSGQAFDVAFDHVDFSYTKTPIFKDLTVRFPANRVTALVGPSGSGKTTLTHLIARFWDVNSGSSHHWRDRYPGYGCRHLKQPDFHGVPGCLPFPGHGAKQHHGGKHLRHGEGVNSEPQNLPNATTLSWRFQKVMTQFWMKTAPTCQAAKNSAYPLPGPYSKTPRSFFWMKPPHPWTLKTPISFSRHSTPWWPPKP